MAALTRPSEATYTINEEVTVRTSDREEHTFCGVMFPIKCKSTLPVDRIIVTSISVRGRLGPLTVWVTNDPDEMPTSTDTNDTKVSNDTATAIATAKAQHDGETENDDDSATKNLRTSKTGLSLLRKNHITAHPSQWTKIYSQYHRPSMSRLQELDLSSHPIIIKPDQVRGIYVHSTLPGDEAIVYDNHYGQIHSADTPSDDFIAIPPALAHVSEEPFGTVPIWGWGDPWRRDRKFVGSVNYGVVYRLWNPTVVNYFGDGFGGMARLLFMCQRRWESPMSRLPDECIFYILNMMRWDWVGDTVEGMEERAGKRKEKQRQREEEEKEEEKNEEEKNDDDEKVSVGASKETCCNKDESASSKPADDDFHIEFDSMDDDEEDDNDAEVIASAPELYCETDLSGNDDDAANSERVSWLRRFLAHNSHRRHIFANYEVAAHFNDDAEEDDDDDDYDEDSDYEDGNYIRVL